MPAIPHLTTLPTISQNIQFPEFIHWVTFPKKNQLCILLSGAQIHSSADSQVEEMPPARAHITQTMIPVQELTSLLHHPSITACEEVLFSNIYFSEDLLATCISALQNKSRLCVVSFSHCRFENPKDLASLVRDPFRSNPHTLILTDCALQDEDLKDFVANLSKNTTCTSLNLTYNRFTDLSGKRLCDVIPDTALRFLDVRGNAITPEKEKQTQESLKTTKFAKNHRFINRTKLFLGTCIFLFQNLHHLAPIIRALHVLFQLAKRVCVSVLGRTRAEKIQQSSLEGVRTLKTDMQKLLFPAPPSISLPAPSPASFELPAFIQRSMSSPRLLDRTIEARESLHGLVAPVRRFRGHSV